MLRDGWYRLRALFQREAMDRELEAGAKEWRRLIAAIDLVLAAPQKT